MQNVSLTKLLAGCEGAYYRDCWRRTLWKSTARGSEEGRRLRAAIQGMAIPFGKLRSTPRQAGSRSPTQPLRGVRSAPDAGIYAHPAGDNLRKMKRHERRPPPAPECAAPAGVAELVAVVSLDSERGGGSASHPAHRPALAATPERHRRAALDPYRRRPLARAKRPFSP